MNKMVIDGYNFYADVHISLDYTQITHTRRSLGALMDLIGIFGGLAQILFMVTACIVAPYAAHSYRVDAIRKLYLASGGPNNIFLDP